MNNTIQHKNNYEILTKKNCFLSGASGGIGREIAMDLGAKGCNLFLTSRSSSKLELLKDDLKRINPDILIKCFNADLTNLAEVENAGNEAKEFFETVDILINCAGIFQVKPLNEFTTGDFNRHMDINLRSAFIYSKIFSQQMKKSGWGRIVNIGSSSSYGGSPNTALYCMTKHGLLGFSRALKEELKPYNIRVYCISPSGTQTKMGEDILGQDYDSFLQPREVAEYISFAISFDGQMITDELRLNRLFVG